MVTSFDEIPTRAYTSLVIQEVGTTRPSAEKLDRVDEIAAGIHGFAFRYGIGSGEPNLNTYEYGYILPQGGYIDKHILDDVRADLVDAGVRDPWVRVKSIWVDGEEFDSMDLIGTPPWEALKGLRSFAEDFEKYTDE